jgi:hypothetical protein
VLWGLYLASRISTWPYASDRPFPTLVLSALLVLSAVQLFKMRFPTVVDRIIPSPDDQENELQQDMQELRESEEEASTSRLLQMVGVITLLPIVVYYLGFLLVFPVFVFGLIYYLDRSLKKAGAATTVFTVLWYVVFIELLNIPIWLGQLFGGTIG